MRRTMKLMVFRFLYPNEYEKVMYEQMRYESRIRTHWDMHLDNKESNNKKNNYER